jgi:thiamine monophosphate synthase
MTDRNFSPAMPSNTKDGLSGNDLQGLIKKANDAGIITVSAHGGLTEHILRDAIATAESLSKYYKDHPEE